MNPQPIACTALDYQCMVHTSQWSAAADENGLFVWACIICVLRKVDCVPENDETCVNPRLVTEYL